MRNNKVEGLALYVIEIYFQFFIINGVEIRIKRVDRWERINMSTNKFRNYRYKSTSIVFSLKTVITTVYAGSNEYFDRENEPWLLSYVVHEKSISIEL